MATIIKQTDPAVTEMKRIVETLLKIKTTFVYANLFEANFGLDSLEGNQFPAFIFVATNQSKEKLDENDSIIRTIPIVGMMVNIIDQSTTDITSEEADPYINQMRELGENLVYNLNKSDMTHKLEPITDVTYDKIYGRFDKHTFGVGMSFNWAINTLKSGCFS